MQWISISKQAAHSRKSARARAHAPILVHALTDEFVIAIPETPYYDWQLPPPQRKIRRKKTLGASHALRTGPKGRKKRDRSEAASRADASAVPAPLTRQPTVNDDNDYCLRYMTIMSRLMLLEYPNRNRG